MGSSSRVQPRSEHQSRLSLWFTIFVGPLAWATDSALSYSLTQQACAAQSSGFLLVFSAIAFGATMTGLLVAVRAKRTLPPRARDTDATRADPTRFLVLSGIALGAGFLLAILAAAIPRLTLDPCA